MRIVIALLLSLVPASWAICPFPRPAPCSLYFKADAVFVGTVKSDWQLPEDRKHDDGTAYRLTVSRWFKGGNTKSVIVYSGSNSGREPLDENKTYLVFATKGDDKAHPFIIWCYDTFSDEEFAKAVADTETVIVANRRHDPPTITVIVGDADMPKGDSLIEGVRVDISGPNGVLHGTTNKNGEFKVQVPPGTYRVNLPGRRYQGSVYGNAYESGRVAVSYGECAFVVMVTTR